MATKGSEQILVTRYGSAIFALAKEKGALGQIQQELVQLQKLYQESKSLRWLAESPTLSRREQEKGVMEIAKKFGLSDMTRNFLRLLAKNRRLSLFPAIASWFASRMAVNEGEIEAEVITATPLSEKTIRAMEEGLKKALGGKVRLQAKEKPAILGGAMLRVGAKMVDHSTAGKLDRLRNELLAA